MAKGCGNADCHTQNFVKTLCFLTFWLVAMVIATPFCHKKNSLEFRTIISFQRNLQRNPNEISTKNLTNKMCGKTFCHNHCHNLFCELVLFKEYFCRLIVTQNLRSKCILLASPRKNVDQDCEKVCVLECI